MITVENEQKGLSVVGDICIESKATNRVKILEYEEMAKQLPQIDIPVTHHIHGGMYGREITIPKGAVITGQIYKFDHFDIMISGDITVSTDTGETKRLTGFNIFKGLSGKKRAGYAHEDTRWVTFHPFFGNDGDEIQKNITAETFEELEEFFIQANIMDYFSFVSDSGMTQEEIISQVENTDDLLGYNTGFNDLYVSESKIEGQGLFCNNKITSGDEICLARLAGLRTPAGRYCNHAVLPNARITIEQGSAVITAVRDIDPREEITVNYREVMNNRFLEGDLCQE